METHCLFLGFSVCSDNIEMFIAQIQTTHLQGCIQDDLKTPMYDCTERRFHEVREALATVLYSIMHVFSKKHYFVIAVHKGPDFKHMQQFCVMMTEYGM